MAKGVTTAQFDFKTPVTQAKLSGVWNVNGVEYSFDELELVADIVAASAPTVNQVRLFNLLSEAGIKNLNEDFIAQYANAINTAQTAPEWIKDVQTIIDEVNEDNADAAAEAAVVNAVVDATNQIQLLPILKANFDRVNSDWIAAYAGQNVAVNTPTGMLALAGPTNYFDPTNTNNEAATKALIQTAIDTVNNARILADDTAADTAAKQAAVTTLIKNYVADDVAPATTKADAITASEINRLGLVVAEATTENSLYNALVAYANATPNATLQASELNANLKSFYLAEMNATNNTKRNTAIAGFTNASNVATYDYKTNIVQAADAAALADVATDLGAAATALDTTDNAANRAAFKAELERLAKYTSHQTAANAKFLMSTIDDALLVDYADQMDTDGIGAASTVANIQGSVSTVNGSANESAYLATIKDANATTVQVRDALTELASANSNITTDAFVNASAQIKLEVAQFIIDNRDNLATGAAYNVASVTDHAAVALAAGDGDYNTNAIQQAMVDHTAKVADFNAIGDLDGATTTATKAALDTYAYAPYEALTNLQKLDVAAEINKLTKSDGATPPTITPLDFSGADAVTTLKAANDIIDAAIAAIK